MPYRSFEGVSVAKTLVIVLLCLQASFAAAEGCPKKPAAEEAGKHWCYDAGKRGHVHLWKPDAFKPDDSVTVVYIHGYNLGDDDCANRHYVDCAWDKHRLAAQFAKSGTNALFVAIESPISDDEKPKWASLDALLDSIRDKGKANPPSRVIVVAHSGGMFTAEHFLNDDHLVQVVSLDALYRDAPARLAKWYKDSRRRRLTMVGASCLSETTSTLGKQLGCTTDPEARCYNLIDASIDHMKLVRDGRLMPILLARAAPSPSPKAKKKAHARSKSHRKRKR